MLTVTGATVYLGNVTTNLSHFFSAVEMGTGDTPPEVIFATSATSAAATAVVGMSPGVGVLSSRTCVKLPVCVLPAGEVGSTDSTSNLMMYS